MGSIISGASQALGLSADPDAGSGAYADADASMRRALEELDKLGVPSIEAQKILLERPELVGQLNAEQLDPSAFESITEDPALRENMLDAIASEKEASETGFSTEDKARLDAMRRATQSDEQARQSSIMQSMAERGALGSGSELAARLSSGQGTADRAQAEQLNLAAQGAQQRRDALGNMSSMSSNLRGQDLSKASQAASAKDSINQFNAMQRSQTAAQNLSEQQRMAESRVNAANQEQMYNKGLIQQNYQNELSKATGMANANQSMAQSQLAQGQAQAGASQAQAAGNRGLVTSAAGAYFGRKKGADGGVFADGGTKKKETLADKINFGTSFADLFGSKESKKEEPKKKHKTVGGHKYADGGLTESLKRHEDRFRNETPRHSGGLSFTRDSSAQLANAIRNSDLSDSDKELMMLQMQEKIRQHEGKMRNPFHGEGDYQDAIIENVESGQFADGGIDKDQVQAMIDALEMAKQGPNAIVANPYTDTNAQEFMREAQKQPADLDANSLVPQDLGMAYAEGGAPSSYTEGGERIDELIDQGELGIDPSAQNEMMEYLRGNMESEDMEEGRVIEGDSFSGDMLPDRINSGEAVLNVPQQDRMKGDLEDKDAELAGYRKLIQLLGKS